MTLSTNIFQVVESRRKSVARLASILMISLFFSLRDSWIHIVFENSWLVKSSQTLDMPMPWLWSPLSPSLIPPNKLSVMELPGCIQGPIQSPMIVHCAAPSLGLGFCSSLKLVSNLEQYPQNSLRSTTSPWAAMKSLLPSVPSSSTSGRLEGQAQEAENQLNQDSKIHLGIWIRALLWRRGTGFLNN